MPIGPLATEYVTGFLGGSLFGIALTWFGVRLQLALQARHKRQQFNAAVAQFGERFERAAVRSDADLRAIHDTFTRMDQTLDQYAPRVVSLQDKAAKGISQRRRTS